MPTLCDCEKHECYYLDCDVLSLSKLFTTSWYQRLSKIFLQQQHSLSVQHSATQLLGGGGYSNDWSQVLSWGRGYHCPGVSPSPARTGRGTLPPQPGQDWGTPQAKTDWGTSLSQYRGTHPIPSQDRLGYHTQPRQDWGAKTANCNLIVFPK